MKANFDQLQAAVTAAVEEVKNTKGVEQSAITLINKTAEIIKQKVEEALTADAAANQESINAVMSAIDAARSELTASNLELGAAITANS